MPLYNLIKYSDNYQKHLKVYDSTTKDEPNDNLGDSESFKYKVKITGSTPAGGSTKDTKIIVPLQYLSNFWRTLEMRLTNCEVSIFFAG